MPEQTSPTVVREAVRQSVRYESGLSVDAVRNRSQSEIGPVSHRTDHPPFRGSGPSDRGPEMGRNTADGLARWRHSQRHAEAAADWPAIARAWVWLTTPDDQQRAICTASEEHQKRHAKGCHARHGHPKGDAA